jgi:hypothetical protein
MKMISFDLSTQISIKEFKERYFVLYIKMNQLT